MFVFEVDFGEKERGQFDFTVLQIVIYSYSKCVLVVVDRETFNDNMMQFWGYA